jgi:RNA polymerase sigma factor (sigma-70 family)
METSIGLLERLRAGPDEAAWRRLDDIYRPLIRGWLVRDPALRQDADDIVQDVMAVVVREVGEFRRRGVGAFRGWLRVVTAHRALAHRRALVRRPRPLDAGEEDGPLARLADPTSDLSRQWDDEHDRHVLRRLLELVGPQFAASSLEAFRRVVFDGSPPAQVAAELNMTLNAVLLAKSRVLARLRQEAAEFLG